MVQHPDGGVVGDRAGVGKIDGIEITWGQVCHLFGQGCRRGVGEVVEGRIVIELLELIGDRVDHFLTAMADVHAPKPRDPVDHLLAVIVVDISALGAVDHSACALFLERIEIGEGLNEMRVLLEDICGAVHVACPVGDGKLGCATFRALR